MTLTHGDVSRIQGGYSDPTGRGTHRGIVYSPVDYLDADGNRDRLAREAAIPDSEHARRRYESLQKDAAADIALAARTTSPDQQRRLHGRLRRAARTIASLRPNLPADMQEGADSLKAEIADVIRTSSVRGYGPRADPSGKSGIASAARYSAAVRAHDAAKGEITLG